jgi:peptidoglycan/xylan/chitin deacetylase (PgdA/CDA1 family)
LKLRLIAVVFFCASAAAEPAPECMGSYPVHLTFDDGPDARWTPAVLNVLKKYHVPATFFVLGEHFKTPAQQAQMLPLIRRAHNEGHVIGYHGFEHLSSTDRHYSERKIENNFFKVPPALEPYMSVYRRFPMGAGWFRERNAGREERGKTVKDFLAAKGLVHVGWDVDTWDWEKQRQTQLPDSLLNEVCAHRGGVVLLHDIHRFTARNLEEKVIKPLLAAGHRFVTLEEMRRQNGVGGRHFLAFDPEVVGFQYCRGTVNSPDVDQVSADCRDLTAPSESAIPVSSTTTGRQPPR